MKLIDISNTDGIAKTLPSTGKMVVMYNQFDAPFFGKVELNQWFRPIFYMYSAGVWCRLNFVPKGWDEMDVLKEAGLFADMPAAGGATE